MNHAKKSLGTRLYKLQKQEKELTSQVIKYLQKCFAYALAQNKGDPQGVRGAILCMSMTSVEIGASSEKTPQQDTSPYHMV